MSPENIELVRRWFDGLNRGDLRLDLVADDVRIDNIEGTLGGPYLGHEGMRRWWGDVWSAFADLQLQIEEIMATPRAATRSRRPEWRAEGAGAALLGYRQRPHSQGGPCPGSCFRRPVCQWKP